MTWLGSLAFSAVVELTVTEDLVQSVLGAGVLARLRANEAIVGEDIVRTALRRVGPELRGEIEALTTLSWIELEKVERLQDAIAIEAHRDPEALHDEAVRRAQVESLKTVYRIVLGLASDAWLVSRTQTMYRRTRRIGRLVSRIPSRGHAELELTEWPGIRDRYARQVGIAVETLLSLTGRTNVSVRHTMTPEGARFTARWEGR